MAAVLTNVSLTASDRKAVYQAFDNAGRAELDVYLVKTFTIRDKARKWLAPDAGGTGTMRAKDVVAALHTDLTAHATNDVQRDALKTSVGQYWSQVNVAEKALGARAVLDSKQRTITFSGEKLVVVVTGDRIQKFRDQITAIKGIVKNDDPRGKFVRQSDGTFAVELFPVSKPEPRTPSGGAESAPVKSAEEEAKDLLNALPSQVIKATKGADGKPRKLTEKEQQQVAAMAKQLILALGAQEGDLSELSLKSVIATLKGITALPQVKAMVAK